MWPMFYNELEAGPGHISRYTAHQMQKHAPALFVGEHFEPSQN